MCFYVFLVLHFSLTHLNLNYRLIDLIDLVTGFTDFIYFNLGLSIEILDKDF